MASDAQVARQLQNEEEAEGRLARTAQRLAERERPPSTAASSGAWPRAPLILPAEGPPPLEEGGEDQGHSGVSLVTEAEYLGQEGGPLTGEFQVLANGEVLMERAPSGDLQADEPPEMETPDDYLTPEEQEAFRDQCSVVEGFQERWVTMTKSALKAEPAFLEFRERMRESTREINRSLRGSDWEDGMDVSSSEYSEDSEEEEPGSEDEAMQEE